MTGPAKVNKLYNFTTTVFTRRSFSSKKSTLESGCIVILSLYNFLK